MTQYLFVDAHVIENIKRMRSQRMPPSQFTLPAEGHPLVQMLIESLGDLSYLPAADKLLALQGTEYEQEAAAALKKIAPDRLEKSLLSTAKDSHLDSYLREKAMARLCQIRATNCVRELIPLLDDTTPIVYSHPMPGGEWRVCDRAGVTISILMGWEYEMRTMQLYARPELREQMMKRVREWAKTAK